MHVPARKGEIQGLLKDSQSLTASTVLDSTVDYDLLERQLTEEEWSARIAGGKVISILMCRDTGECNLSKSVYDAAMVMPQISRSAGNPTSLLHLAARSYILLVANAFLQCFILYMICQEEFVMDKIAGRMHLCNFGAHVETCAGGGGVDCFGPSGTNFQTASRMHDFSDWSMRTFVKDSLNLLYPDKEADIKANVDPGEYGVENYAVRSVCVFVFMMSVMSDLRNTGEMLALIYYSPSTVQPWMQYMAPTWAPKAQVKAKTGKSDIDFCKFRWAGMPIKWKAINVIFIIIPKLLIWRSTAQNGVTFLMETSRIESAVVNVTALAFILSLDEMLFQLYAHGAMHHILDNMEPYRFTDTSQVERHNAAQSLLVLQEDIDRRFLDLRFVPWRPLVTLGMTALFIFLYYHQYCRPNPMGGLVSKSLGYPASPVYPLLSFFFPLLSPMQEAGDMWHFPATLEK
mmetsp:Transcript_107783/g.310392  ORF Transcript_107783/g.310392 Transcript_107783/m.310392 type:complete len:459 (-) Transcript_107783:158-1534(-)